MKKKNIKQITARHQSQRVAWVYSCRVQGFIFKADLDFATASTPFFGFLYIPTRLAFLDFRELLVNIF